MRPTAGPRSHSRLIRNPGTDPRIEVRICIGEYRHTGEAPSVEVRCSPCNKRLFDVTLGREFLGEDYGMVEDGTLVVTRKCPQCGRLNEGRVTRTVGQPYESRDALNGPWRCTHCSRSLGKVDPVRGRVTTRCRCGQETRATALDAIKAAYQATL
jgi:phage FluMu protein Com